MQESELLWNQVYCGYCKKTVTKGRGEKRRRYCNNACKQAAYRYRHGERLIREQILGRRARIAAILE